MIDVFELKVDMLIIPIVTRRCARCTFYDIVPLQINATFNHLDKAMYRTLNNLSAHSDNSQCC